MDIKEIDRLAASIFENWECGNITGGEAAIRMSAIIPNLLTHIKDLEAENKRLQQALEMDKDERLPFYFNLARTEYKENERLREENKELAFSVELGTRALAVCECLQTKDFTGSYKPNDALSKDK